MYLLFQTDSSVKHLFNFRAISASHSFNVAHKGNSWFSFLSGTENLGFATSVRNLPTACTMYSYRFNSVLILSFILKNGTSYISQIFTFPKKTENCIKFLPALFYQLSPKLLLSARTQIHSYDSLSVQNKFRPSTDLSINHKIHCIT